MDENFYRENYPDCKKVKSPREYYLKIGIMKGDIYSKDTITSIYKESKFVNNKNLSYQGNEYTLDSF